MTQLARERCGGGGAPNTGLYAVPFSGMHADGHGRHLRGDHARTPNDLFTVSTWKEDSCVAVGRAADAEDARRRIESGELRVRRLTPLECERVQGFPDNWTARGTGEAGEDVAIAETHRYRLCGNAVMPPVAEFLGGML